MDERPENRKGEPEPPAPPNPTDPAAEEPRSTILSADPVLSSDAAASRAGGPEVAWTAPAPNEVEVPGAPGLVFAGVGTRFVAYVIDSVLLFVPLTILSSLLTPPALTPAAGQTQSFDEILATTDPIYTIAYIVLSLAYFVAFWLSGGRATLGMRAMKLQVGNAFDGRTLTAGQGLTRWAVLGFPLGLLTIFGPLAALGGLIGLLWPLVLLISTATSPTKQGVHDRLANSAVVQPAGTGMSGAAMACLVAVVLLVAFALLSIVALIFLGSQISAVLEQGGQP